METESYNIDVVGVDSVSIPTETTTTEIVSVPSEDLQYLIQVEEHILGTNLVILLFFFIYCFCSAVHLMFKNF